jgi:hypothetical protein
MAGIMEPEEGHRLTNTILSKAISKAMAVSEDEVKIVKFELTAGSNKGDNFMCVMKAVSIEAKVSGKSKQFNLMAKCMPMNPIREKQLREVRACLHAVI